MKHISSSLINQNNDKQLELIQFVGIIGSSSTSEWFSYVGSKSDVNSCMLLYWDPGVVELNTAYDDLNDFILIERNCAQKIEIHTVSQSTVMD